jgi:hypothetical protein
MNHSFLQKTYQLSYYATVLYRITHPYIWIGCHLMFFFLLLMSSLTNLPVQLRVSIAFIEPQFSLCYLFIHLRRNRSIGLVRYHCNVLSMFKFLNPCYSNLHMYWQLHLRNPKSYILSIIDMWAGHTTREC